MKERTEELERVSVVRRCLATRGREIVVAKQQPSSW